MQINVTVTDANNIVCTVVPPQAQTITIDRGIAGNGISSISTINIDGDEYLHIVFTNGTSSNVGPISATYYTGTSPINVNNTTNVISLGTVPVANGGTGLTSFTANGVVFASSTSALTTGTALTFDGSRLATTGRFNSAGLYEDTSGNLGLGVTPSAWGTGNKAFELQGGSLWSGATSYILLGQNVYQTNAGGTYYYKNTAAASMAYQNAGQHIWYNAASGTAGTAITFTQAMTLDVSGRWLLGGTSMVDSGFALMQYSGASYNGLVFNDTDTGAAGNYVMRFRRNGSLVGSVFTSTTTTTYNVTSDYRLKNVIGAVTGAGNRIDALEPVEYEWKSDGSRTRGFLAHKFQEVYAGSVSGTKDAVDAEGNPVYQSMQASTSEVIADLVSEIQSLRKRLAALEAK